jgi:hypothetical protein
MTRPFPVPSTFRTPEKSMFLAIKGLFYPNDYVELCTFFDYPV